MKKEENNTSPKDTWFSKNIAQPILIGCKYGVYAVLLMTVLDLIGKIFMSHHFNIF